MSFWALLYLIPFLLVLLKREKHVGARWKDRNDGFMVVIKDTPLKCSHCEHTRFQKREGLITTSWVTLFRFQFLNRSARCFLCKKCGFLHWFVISDKNSEVRND